jgi:MFS family permease
VAYPQEARPEDGMDAKPRRVNASVGPTPGGLPRNVWAVTATSFLGDVSSEMLSSVLPLFLANVLGARTAAIGLVEGTAETTASLLKMASGALSDRLGRRKGLAVLGYGLSALAKPFLYLANSWGAVLGVRFADRAGKGLRTAPRDALVADSVPTRLRGLAFGLHRAGDTGGAVLGIGIALLVLLPLTRSGAALDRSMFQRLVLFSTVPAFLAVVVLALGAREVTREAGSVTATRPSRATFDRTFLRFIGILVVFTLGNSSDAFLILRAQNTGLGVLAILGMMLTFNLVYALVATPAGALSDRLGRRHMLLLGWLLYGLTYLGFAVLRAGWQAWLMMLLYGVYYGLTEGAAKALVADLVPAEARGSAYGVYNAAIGLTTLPASVLAGMLWQGIGSWPGLGPSAPFFFGAGLALLAAVLLVRLPRPQEA